jgi:hypothetical protein
LTQQEVKDLVEDDYEVRTERQELKAQQAILAKGREICRQIGTRPDLGPVSRISSTNIKLCYNSDAVYQYEHPKFQARDTTQAQTRPSGGTQAQCATTSSAPRHNYPMGTSSSSTPGTTQVQIFANSSSPNRGYHPSSTQYQTQTIPPAQPRRSAQQSPPSSDHLQPVWPEYDLNTQQQGYAQLPNQLVNEDVGRSGPESIQDTASTNSGHRNGQPDDGKPVLHKRPHSSSKGFFGRGKKKSDDN